MSEEGGVEAVSKSVEAVLRRCRLTLVFMVSRCVDPCRPPRVTEGGLTVVMRRVGRVKVSIVSSVGVSCVEPRACQTQS